MQLSQKTRQFFEDNNIEITDAGFERYRRDIPDDVKYCHEHLVYGYIYCTVNFSVIKKTHYVQFLLSRNTAISMFMLGELHDDVADHGSEDNFYLTQAIMYYKKSYAMGYANSCYQIAKCYRYSDDTEYLKYAHLSADKHNDARSYFGLATYYDIKDNLREARRYFNLCIDVKYDDAFRYASSCSASLYRVNLDLLGEFETKLGKDDYLLAYELMKTHSRPGLLDLQKLIEKEYSDVLGLLKDLSNIVVSYLLFNKCPPNQYFSYLAK